MPTQWAILADSAFGDLVFAELAKVADMAAADENQCCLVCCYQFENKNL
jgi:hypothetical protein